MRSQGIIVSVTRTSYHHGALRETLLTATLELIEAEGIGAVSLRKVARAAGVSPGAPYHHFPDRAALLTALSDEGFGRLATQLAEAHDAAPTPTEALRAILTEYVEFAKANPAFFRLMFRPELTNGAESAAAATAYAVLEDTLDECLAGTGRTDRDVLAITLWSLAHGFASLWLDGQLAHRTDDPDGLADRVTALVTSYTGRSQP